LSPRDKRRHKQRSPWPVPTAAQVTDGADVS